ncbi:MAG: sigma-70 family RNA polymerase sigma factor [Planctomycetota bacterium]|nr:sigma-70 family RNA polymerase sigma factor [Planctomycetota bacterium]
MRSTMEDHQHIEQTLQKARDGDRNACVALVASCRTRLEAHIRMRVGDHVRQDVSLDDVYQEAVTQALGSMVHCRANDEASFLRWLKGIAEHVILTLARRQRGDKLLYVDHDASAREPTPSKVVRREERLDRLRDALDSLSPDYRTVVYLVRIEGLKIKEAAERMNRTPKAVMHLLGRALKKLKDTFGDTESLSLPPRGLMNGGSGHDG